MKKEDTPHILVISADHLQRLIYKDALAVHGYRVSEASSASEVSLKFENSDASLVVFDEHGQENEAEFLINSLSACNKQVSYLILTSDYSEGRKLFLKRIGYNNILVKPIDLSDFICIISENTGKNEDLDDNSL